MPLRSRRSCGDVCKSTIAHETKSVFLFRQSHRPMPTEKENRLSRPISSGTSLPGGITVEAAFTLPLFLLVCSLFFTFFSGQFWQIRFQKALDEVCEDVSVWSYIVDFADDYTGTDLLTLADGGRLSGALKGSTDDITALLRGESGLMDEIKLFLLEKGSALLWQPLLKEWIIEKLGREALRTAPIKDGERGISLSGSTLHGRDLDLVLTYRIESPLRFPLGLSYPVVQRCCRRLWVGTAVIKNPAGEDPEENEDIVYVTANGTVYHTNRSCRTLNIQMQTVLISELPRLRNTSGGKYYPCERCAKGRLPSLTTAIITIPGSRYHYQADCGSLKRMIAEMPLSEAQEKYRLCRFCEKGE